MSNLIWNQLIWLETEGSFEAYQPFLGFSCFLDHHSTETLLTDSPVYRYLPQQRVQTSCFSLLQPLGRVCLTKHEYISGCLLGNDQAVVAEVFHWHQPSPWKTDDGAGRVRNWLPIPGLSAWPREGLGQLFHVLASVKLLWLRDKSLLATRLWKFLAFDPWYFLLSTTY